MKRRRAEKEEESEDETREEREGGEEGDDDSEDDRSGSEDGGEAEGDGDGSSSDDSSGSEDGGDEVDVVPKEEEIQVEFEFYDLDDNDYHFVKQLLGSYLDNFWNSTELVDFLVKEEDVGTSIRVDDVCFGFISMVNLHHTRSKSLAPLKQILEFILQNLGGDKEKLDTLTSILHKAKEGGSSVGLILNERASNCPPQLAYPLHENFWAEIDYAHAEENKANAAEKYFGSEHYLIVSTMVGNAAPDQPPKKKSRKDEQTEASKAQPTYTKIEDSVYESEALFVHHCKPKKSNRAKWSVAGNTSESKVIMLVEKNKVPQILKKLKDIST